MQIDFFHTAGIIFQLVLTVQDLEMLIYTIMLFSNSVTITIPK